MCVCRLQSHPSTQPRAWLDSLTSCLHPCSLDTYCNACGIVLSFYFCVWHYCFTAMYFCSDYDSERTQTGSFCLDAVLVFWYGLLAFNFMLCLFFLFYICNSYTSTTTHGSRLAGREKRKDVCLSLSLSLIFPFPSSLTRCLDYC